MNVKVTGLTMLDKRRRPKCHCRHLTGLTKEQIRSTIISRLKIEKEEERNQKDRLIKEKLFRIKVFKKAKIVMFYIRLGGEVDTTTMIREAQKIGKIVTVPVCKRNRVTIRPCILDDKAGFKKGPYGVCEPAVKSFIRLEDLDLVIVPAVAFDKKGNRLGRGKGYYDRFLKMLPKDTPAIGLAYDFQILPALPTSKHDVRVNRVIFA